MIPLSLSHQTLLWVFIVSILALLWSIQTVGTHRLTSFLDGMNWAQVLFLNVLYIHALFEGCWRLKITWLWKEFHNFSKWAIKSLLKNDFFIGKMCHKVFFFFFKLKLRAVALQPIKHFKIHLEALFYLVFKEIKCKGRIQSVSLFISFEAA